jgi:hypothetical protein
VLGSILENSDDDIAGRRYPQFRVIAAFHSQLRQIGLGKAGHRPLRSRNPGASAFVVLSHPQSFHPNSNEKNREVDSQTSVRQSAVSEEGYRYARHDTTQKGNCG